MVTAFSLIDAVEKSPYAGESAEDVQVRFVNELVDAALDELRHIEALDICGPTGKWRRLYVRETEVQMRELYQQWLSSAGELLKRVHSIDATGERIRRLDAFLEAELKTRGLLSTTVADIERGREAARRGEVISLEDFRRELRDRNSR